MSSNTFGYIADTGPTQAFGNLPRKYSPRIKRGIDFLVIAGGGSGGAGSSNTGDGGAGTASAGSFNSGGSGVVILRYPKAFTITVGGSLTSSTATDGDYKVTTFTAGTDNVSWA